jgi:hypothetical protein
VSDVKLCVTCRHFGGPGSQAQGICLHPKNLFFDYVLGGHYQSSASYNRNLKDEDRCRPEAVWWEEKRK